MTEFQDTPSRNLADTPRSLLGLRRGRPRSEVAHRAILDAAQAMLLENGYVNLRLEHVAARAGVGKATIYRRWASKEEMALELLLELSAPHTSIDDVGNTREELLTAVGNAVHELTQTPFGPVIRALLAQLANNPKIGEPFRARLVQNRRAEIAHVIERGVFRDDIRADTDVSVATELLVGPVYFRLIFGGALDDDFTHRVVDSVMNGFGIRS